MTCPMAIGAYETRRRGGSKVFAVAALLAVLVGARAAGTAVSTAPLSGSGSFLPQNASGRQLSEREPQEQELRAGDENSYSLKLDSGQYARLAFHSRTLDIELTISGPSGKPVAVSTCHAEDPCSLPLQAERQGTYEVRLRSPDIPPLMGSYRLSVEEMRDATAEDRLLIKAARAYTDGERLKDEWTAASSRAAVGKFEEAANLYAAAGHVQEQAKALRTSGKSYYELGEPRLALDRLNHALRLSRESGDVHAEAETLTTIGLARLQLGDNDEALRDGTRALDLSRSANHRRGEALALHVLGEVYYGRDKNRGLQCYQEALQIWRDLSDLRGQAQALMSAGFSYSDLSQESQAFESYREALRFWIAKRELRGQALSQMGLGHLHAKRGENQTALEEYRQARSLFRSMGDQRWEAATLSGLGFVHRELGEKDKVLEYYLQALHLYQVVSSRRGEAGSLAQVGHAYLELGKNAEALRHLGLAISLFQQLGDKRTESVALNEIGEIYELQGELDTALQHYSHALDLCRGSGYKRNEAYILNNLGRLSFARKETEKALEYHLAALRLNRETADRFGQCQTLYNIARVERERGSLIEARSRLEEALLTAESLRAKVTSPELRSSYFASVHEQHELYIDVLMQMHRQGLASDLEADALRASERARARSLLDSLVEARADIRQGVDAHLLNRERSTKQLLDSKAAEQLRLLMDGPDSERLTTVAKELRDLTTEYEQLQAEIRSKSPRYAAMTQATLLGVKEIQKQVLDDDTLLLEYSLGAERSYLWAVTRESAASYELPNRAEIEPAARRVYEFATARLPVYGERAAGYRQRVTEADRRYWEEAETLSRVLLGPVRGMLRNRRLLIVADGALEYVPFAALLAPGIPGEEAPVPLVVNHEIVRLPSASIIAALRSETELRSQPENTLAVLADPVFELDDPRLRRVAAKSDRQHHSVGALEGQQSGLPDLHRALRDAGLAGNRLGVPRLLASRREAEAILALTSPGKGMKATDFEASRSLAESAELGRYRIVHFATHGLLNNERPELSGLILSLVDAEGQPQSGFLRLHDIYNLKLPADLVVLSACNTALGKEVRGEGLVGLVRGFMYAGAARVVASLWKVDDEATGVLMKRFYQGMLKDNLSPAAALRAAQVAMWKQKQWSSPFYWAAFVLQGEYR